MISQTISNDFRFVKDGHLMDLFDRHFADNTICIHTRLLKLIKKIIIIKIIKSIKTKKYYVI